MAKKIFAPMAFIFGVAFSAYAFGQDEASYLTRFEGRWAGSGRANSILGPVTLDCVATAEAKGSRLTIRGRCSGSGFTRTLVATLRYDPASRAYLGSWNDGTGGAGLSGARRGETLNLTVGAKDGGRSGRMTLKAKGGAFRLSLVKAQGGSAAPLVSIAFQRA